MAGNGAVAAVVLLLGFAALALGCSDDEEADETESGSCDAIAAINECYEVDGDPASVAYERESCEEIGDTWTTEPCPSTNLLGCCVYEFAGDNYRDCYYVGHLDPDVALQESCAEFDGEWRPGSR